MEIEGVTFPAALIVGVVFARGALALVAVRFVVVYAEAYPLVMWVTQGSVGVGVVAVILVAVVAVVTGSVPALALSLVASVVEAAAREAVKVVARELRLRVGDGSGQIVPGENFFQPLFLFLM